MLYDFWQIPPTAFVDPCCYCHREITYSVCLESADGVRVTRLCYGHASVLLRQFVTCDALPRSCKYYVHAEFPSRLIIGELRR